MKRVVPREVTERDIDEIANYYSDEADEDVAHGFVEAVRGAYRAIGDHPGAGSPRYADLLDVPGLRSRKLRRYPYLVFYVEHEDHIDAWRALHEQRDIPASLTDSAD